MVSGRWALFGCLLSAVAAAEAPPVSIWYRSSETCPDGARFVERLEALGRKSRLAGAGDAIDFVVTLGSSEAVSFGRLERQTDRGTVAIREVEAPDCSEVAEALALSLDLALAPQGPGDELPRGETTQSTSPAITEASTPRPEPRKASSAPAKIEPPTDVEDGMSREPSAGRVPQPRLALGAQARATTGIAATPLLGGGVFAELSPETGWWAYA